MKKQQELEEKVCDLYPEKIRKTDIGIGIHTVSSSVWN